MHFVRLALIPLPLVALAAACDGGGSATGRRVAISTATATAVPTDVLAATCVRPPLPGEFEPGGAPSWDPGDEYGDVVEARRAQYRELGIDYRTGYKEYDPAGDYLNYGSIDWKEKYPRFRWDERGIPLVPYDGVYHLQPATTAQLALTLHGEVLSGRATTENFLAAADALIDLQDSRGALPYPFAYAYYRTGERLEPGWVSALAQGQALSVFRRAFDISGDERYLEAGNAALDFMAASTAEGGTRTTLSRLDSSLDRFVFFKEYPTAESQYTLNGFLFDLVGLYDWAGIPDSSHAKLAADLFGCGLATAIYVLPYHDIGGISAYDLGHIVEGGEPNVQPAYHAIHIQLLQALNSVAPQPELAYWRDRWMAQVDE